MVKGSNHNVIVINKCKPIRGQGLRGQAKKYLKLALVGCKLLEKEAFHRIGISQFLWDLSCGYGLVYGENAFLLLYVYVYLHEI